MRHVERDGYHLLDWSPNDQRTLLDLWTAVPEIVIGRYLVNTSFDSGHLTLTPEETSAGWKMIGALAHSPKIEQLSEVPNSQYDEWLVFDSPTDVPEFETMVNYQTFTPIDFDWHEKLERYWSQILTYHPRHVLAENQRLYVVTADENVLRKLQTI